jgi:hypothetical protein
MLRIVRNSRDSLWNTICKLFLKAPLNSFNLVWKSLLKVGGIWRFRRLSSKKNRFESWSLSVGCTCCRGFRGFRSWAMISQVPWNSFIFSRNGYENIIFRVFLGFPTTFCAFYQDDSDFDDFSSSENLPTNFTGSTSLMKNSELARGKL